MSGPIVTVVGSLSAVSRQQAQVLESNADLTVFVPTPALLRTGETHPLWQSLRDQIGEALSAGRDVMIRTGLEEHNDLTYGHALCESLGSLVLPLAPAIGALIATGGETARALLPTFGTHALQLIREIEPGVPLTGLGQTADSRHYQGRRVWLARRTPQKLQRARPHPQRQRGRLNQKDSYMYRPLIAITMGDAAGIGPEIIMKSLAKPALYETCRPLVIGDAARLRQAGALCGVDLQVKVRTRIEEATFTFGQVDCLDLGLIPVDLPFGKLSAIAGDAAYRYVAKAVELIKADVADAICTAPLNKEALHAGGHLYPAIPKCWPT